MVLEDFDDFQTKSPSPRAICRRPCIWKEIWRCVAWSLEQTYVTETTSAPQIHACAHYSCVPAFHRPSWTLEATLPRGSCAGSLSSDGEPESRALNVFLVQCQNSRF